MNRYSGECYGNQDEGKRQDSPQKELSLKAADPSEGNESSHGMSGGAEAARFMLSPAVLLNDNPTAAKGFGDRLGTAVHSQLAVDAGQMPLYRAVADVQLVPDGAVG